MLNNYILLLNSNKYQIHVLLLFKKPHTNVEKRCTAPQKAATHHHIPPYTPEN